MFTGVPSFLCARKASVDCRRTPGPMPDINAMAGQKARAAAGSGLGA
jgi:hypothetical protein